MSNSSIVRWLLHFNASNVVAEDSKTNTNRVWMIYPLYSNVMKKKHNAIWPTVTIEYPPSKLRLALLVESSLKVRY